ncbi:hypothetical protein BDZ45DRAFT_137623 [Acephala macrosclerotiorum]|nr:hypothetical protein BDZ45DRAFT_137623 [Acephala macrosclerotiorum]
MDRQSIILGPSGIVTGTDTISFPSATGPLTITIDGVTLTFDPASSSTLLTSSVLQTSLPASSSIGSTFSASQSSVPVGIVIGGSSFGFPSSSEALTEPDGQTVVLGPSDVVIRSDTMSFPTVTTPPVLTTDGLTFTLEPAGPAPTSTHGGILLGGSSFSFPSSSETITKPNGETVVLGPSGIIIGTDSISFPCVTTPTVFTTDGLTFTLELGSVSNSPNPTATPSEVFIDGNPFFLGTGSQTSTESNGQALTLGPNGLIFGTNTIPFPPPCSTITTFAIDFGLPCITTTSIPLSTSSSPVGTGPSPIFTA